MNDSDINQPQPANSSDPAVSLIRAKVASLYGTEPELKAEIAEVKAGGAHSKHQLFMKSLLDSGKNYADIQVAWHNYYISLSDAEKHEVWQEFYSNQSRQSHFLAVSNGSSSSSDTVDTKEKPEKPKDKVIKHIHAVPKKIREVKTQKSVADIKQTILSRVSADGRLTPKHHFKSLFFGISLAGLVALVLGFILYNPIIITPFITPSTKASSTPLIADASGTITVGPETRIIVPKINVDAPIVLDAPDIEEKSIQAALEKGVTLYPNTGKPGELANPVIFGHSSNNLFNGGDYKFVFVLLNKLETGDTFMINYQGKQYIYRVSNKKIVKPTEVGVLDERPHPAMVTLITCDPPGTNTNRLIVQAEQISPDPNANIASTEIKPEIPPQLAGDAESLFSRMWNSIF